jgi:hypothetical protein
MEQDAKSAVTEVTVELEGKGPKGQGPAAEKCVCPECGYEGETTDFKAEMPAKEQAEEMPINPAEQQNSGTAQPTEKPPYMSARAAAEKAMRR